MFFENFLKLPLEEVSPEMLVEVARNLNRVGVNDQLSNDTLSEIWNRVFELHFQFSKDDPEAQIPILRLFNDSLKLLLCVWKEGSHYLPVLDLPLR